MFDLGQRFVSAITIMWFTPITMNGKVPSNASQLNFSGYVEHAINISVVSVDRNALEIWQIYLMLSEVQDFKWRLP